MSRDKVLGQLKSSKLLSQRPSFIPSPKPTKPQLRRGLQYEARVAAEIQALATLFDAQSIHGQWLEFEDDFGQAWAQPDVLVLFPDAGILYEVKYTYTHAANSKLRNLYLPIVQLAIPKKRWRLVQVCKNLILDIDDPPFDPINPLDGRYLSLWHFP